MCATCPYRGGVAKSDGWDEIVQDVLAAGRVGDAPMPCHEDDPYEVLGIQCRGNAEGTRMLRRILATRSST
jgi:hypothetical protein